MRNPPDTPGRFTHHLGKERWKVERTISWLTNYRRLATRYERYGYLYAGFLALAAALICFKHAT